MRILTLAVALLCAVPLSAQDRIPVRVYTTSDPSGFVDARQQDRLDSVKDLTKEVQRTKGLALVDSGERLGLEVTSRGVDEPGKRGGTYYYTLRVTLHVGDYSTEFVGWAKPMEGWRKAASDVADQAVKWIKANQSKLGR